MGKKNYGSVYGQPYQRFRYLLKYIENYYGKKVRILMLNDRDGLHTLSAIRKGYKIDCYESNTLFLNGGLIDGYKVIGLKEKIRYFNMNDNINIFYNNFYENIIDKHYDLIYCYKSLHLKENSHIDLKKKVKKILTATKKGGFVYIFYHLAKVPFDYHNYPKNEYFRKGEMIGLFDSSWEIIFIKENNIETCDFPHPYNNKMHKHLVGHIFAKKINYRDYESFYNISVMSDYKHLEFYK